MKKTTLDHVMDVVVYFIVVLAIIITLYPMVYVLSMSISAPIAAASNRVFLFPVGFSVESYKLVFSNPEIWQTFSNTVWYTGVGTAISVAVTTISAYPLSRRRFVLRNGLMYMVAFTMFFGGGLIPTFILVNNLGLYGTRWSIVLPSAISTWNLILCRTFFQNIPDSLEEAATIDGASQFQILFRIFLPLSMPIVAVLILFYAVGQWNSYFPALLYLPDSKMHPIQMYLRKVLVIAESDVLGSVNLPTGAERSLAMHQIRYSVIIVTVMPILIVYPFLQRYFVKGVMIGSLKG